MNPKAFSEGALFLVGIINLVLLVWFIITLNGIARNVEQIAERFSRKRSRRRGSITSAPEVELVTISYVCPHCRDKNKVATDLVGKKVLCQSCNEPFTVPKGIVAD